ncbi:MAG: hypothetical protein AUK47_09625 [Deltaproteobacteria bacterium CG2_30_63_29]|nr:MAG: hypothetical protein AUK47_09625 [Deltaproteobacteria bacterium CG2_30_63_29]
MNSLRDAFAADPRDDRAFLAVYTELLSSRDLEELVEVYRQRASAVDLEQARYLYLTVAEVWSQRLGMPGLSTEALFSAFELDPRCRPVRDKLREHLEAQRDWTMLARMYDLEARNAVDESERGRALLRFGHFLYEKLHDVSEAAQVLGRAADASPEVFTSAVIALQRLRRLEPNSAEVARMLLSLLGSVPDPADLVSVLDEELRRIPSEDRERRAEVLCQLAQVYLEQLGETTRAFELLSRAHEVHPDLGPRVRVLLSALIDAEPDFLPAEQLRFSLDVELQDWEEAVAAGRKVVAMATDPAVQAAALLQTAKIQVEHLDQIEEAVDSFVAAYHRDMESGPAVIAALRELFIIDSLNLRIREAIVELLESEGDHEGLLALWGEIAANSPSTADRAFALWRKGCIELEQLGDQNRALLAFQAAAELVGDDQAGLLLADVVEIFETPSLRGEVIDVVRVLAAKAGRWDSLSDLLSRYADDAVEKSERAQLLRELGSIQELHLGDLERAQATYRAAVKADATDPDSIAVLRNLAQRKGEFEQALALLDVEFGLTLNPGRRAGLQVERARLHHLNGDPIAALWAFGEVLLFDDEGPDTAYEIEQLLQAQGSVVLDAFIARASAEESGSLGWKLLSAMGMALYRNNGQNPIAMELLLASLRGDPSRFDAYVPLIEHLRGSDTPAILAEVLQWLVRTTSNEETKRTGLQELDGIFELHGEIDGLSEAIGWTRLEVDPSRERFDVLVEHFERTNNASSLAQVYLWAADRAPWLQSAQRAEKLDFLRRAAALYDVPLGDQGSRAAVFRRVLDVDRNDEGALDFFREQLLGEPLAYYQILAPSAPMAKTAEQRARRQIELALLSQESIGDVDRAIFHWNQVLGIEDAPVEMVEEAFGALKAIYVERDRRQELMDLLRTRARASSDPEQKVDFLWEIVTLQREQGHDEEGTQHSLEQILRILPDDPRALASLSELEHINGNHFAAAEHLKKLVEVTEGEPQRRHRFRLIRLYCEQLWDWHEALAILKVELRERPGSSKGIRELEKLLLDGDWEVDERLQAWLDTVDEQLEGCEPERALELEMMKARVLESHTERTEEAMQAWRRALTRAPDNQEAALALGSLLEHAGQWQAVVEHYQGLLERELPRELSCRLYIAIGDAYFNGLESKDLAVEAYQRALQVESGNKAAMGALLRCARESADTTLHLESLERFVALDPGVNSAPYLGEMASLYEQAGDLEQASKTIEQLVDTDPLDEAALGRLQSLYKRLGHSHRLAGVLGRLAGLSVDDGYRQHLMLEQANLLQNELGDLSAALSVHQQILAATPQFVPSLEAVVALNRVLGEFEDALEALEVLIRLEPDRRIDRILLSAEIMAQELGLSEAAFTRLKWAHELSPLDERPVLGMWTLARDRKLWPNLVDVLEQDVLHIDDPDEQVRVLRNVAELAEDELGDLARAFHNLRQAHLLAPRSPELIEELERVAELSGHWLDLTVVYRSMVDSMESVDAQVACLQRVAEITAQRMDNPDAAFDVLLEILDEYPGEESTIERLNEVAEEFELWGRLVEFYDEALAHNTDEAVNRTLLLNSAHLCLERLNDGDEALERFIKVLQMGTPDADVVDAIHSLPSMDERAWSRVISAVMAPRPLNEEGRIEQGLLAKHIYEQILGDGNAAFGILLELVRELPLAVRAFEAALEVGARLERLGEISALLEAALAKTLDKSVALALLEGIVQVYECQKNIGQVVDTLRRILELEPSHVTATERLNALTVDTEHAQQLLRTLETQVQRLTSPEEKGAKLLEIASLLERMDRLVDAASSYDRALKLCPDLVNARRSLIAVASRLGRWPTVVQHLETILTKDLAPLRTREDNLLLARVYVQELGDTDRGALVLRKLLEQDPSDREVFQRLEKLLESNKRWSELLALYERQLEHAPSDMERRRFLFELATIALDHFQNKPKALAALEMLAAEEEVSVEVLTRLNRTYRSIDRWREAAQITQRLVLRTREVEERERLLWNLLEIQKDRLNDAEEALQTLSLLAELLPSDAAPWIARAEILESLGRQHEAHAHYLEAVSRLDGIALANVWYAIGRLRQEFLLDPEGAREAFQNTVEIDPRHKQAVIGLKQIAHSGDDEKQQLALLKLELEQANSDEERAVALWRKAVMERDTFDRALDAEATLRRALQYNPRQFASHRDLADLLFTRGEWDESAAHYQSLLKELAQRGEHEELGFPLHRLRGYEMEDTPDRVLFQVRLAMCHEHLGDFHKASAIYGSAVDSNRNNLGILVGLARSYYKTGNWSGARKHLERLLLEEKHELLATDQAQLNFYLGDIQHGSNQLTEALDSFERALKHDPSFRPAADQRLAILIKDCRWTQTIPAFEHLLELTNDKEERGAIYSRMGEVYGYFLNSPNQAIVAYEHAMVLGGDIFDVPERLLHLYVANEMWDKARVLAEALVEEGAPTTHARVEYLIVLGDVLSNGLNELDAALQVYERAFSADPSNILALERIGRLHGLQGNQNAMADLYNEYLTAMGDDDVSTRAEVLFRYADQLLETCDAPDSAVVIFKQLNDLVPNDVRVHQRLASLYGHRHINEPESELHHLRKLVELREVESADLERISVLYERMNEFNGSAAVNALLRFIANEADNSVAVRTLQPNTLAGDLYERLIVPTYGSGPLARLFEHLAELGTHILGTSIEDLNLPNLEELTARKTTPAVAIFRELNRAMGLGERRLFIQKAAEMPVRIVADKIPCVVLSDEVFKGLIGHELRFFLARALELTRPRFLLASSMGAFELLTLLRTLLGELARSRTPPAKPSLVERQTQQRVRRFLAELRAKRSIEVQEELEGIVEQVERFHIDDPPSAKRYVDSARASSIRMGLIASGSQSAALKRLLKEDQGSALYRPKSFDAFVEMLSVSADLHNLVSYLLSGEYLEVLKAVYGPGEPQASKEPLARAAANSAGLFDGLEEIAEAALGSLGELDELPVSSSSPTVFPAGKTKVSSPLPPGASGERAAKNSIRDTDLGLPSPVHSDREPSRVVAAVAPIPAQTPVLVKAPVKNPVPTKAASTPSLVPVAKAPMPAQAFFSRQAPLDPAEAPAPGRALVPTEAPAAAKAHFQSPFAAMAPTAAKAGRTAPAANPPGTGPAASGRAVLHAEPQPPHRPPLTDPPVEGLGQFLAPESDVIELLDADLEESQGPPPPPDPFDFSDLDLAQMFAPPAPSDPVEVLDLSDVAVMEEEIHPDRSDAEAAAAFLTMGSTRDTRAANRIDAPLTTTPPSSGISSILDGLDDEKPA